MNISLTNVFLLALLASCSHINRESQDYYYNKAGRDTVRHGLIPVESKSESTPNGNSAAEMPPITGFDAIKANRGEKLYANHCLSCHGLKGEGNGARAMKENLQPRNLVEIVKQVPEFKLFMSISQWKGKMPGWKNAMSDEELEQVAHYLKKLAQSN